jgi:hypothetical protein
MKKLMALMIGTGLVLSTVAISFAQDQKEEPTKTEKKKKKKSSKKKKSEKKQEETKPGA